MEFPESHPRTGLSTTPIKDMESQLNSLRLELRTRFLSWTLEFLERQRKELQVLFSCSLTQQLRLDRDRLGMLAQISKYWPARKAVLVDLCSKHLTTQV